MQRILASAVVALVPLVAAADPVVVTGTGTVSETVDRLKASIKSAGARVFGVFDFGGGIRFDENVRAFFPCWTIEMSESTYVGSCSASRLRIYVTYT